MKALSKRLQRLEQRIPKPEPQSNFRPVEFIQGWLAKRGLVRLESESLFDAFARSLGMTSLALRRHFHQRLAGSRPG
jgi:hypothetical protein